MIFFTADTHLNHANVIKLAKRPFTTIDEMHNTIITKWNATVSPGDTIYHLGDFALTWGKKHKNFIDDILSKLNGQKWLITGNHDRGEVYKSPRWHMIRDYYELKVDIGGCRKRIVMSHYPLRVWNGMHRGSWMLHGHSHGNLVDIGGLTMDVGVDVNGFKPVSLEQVDWFMSGRKIVTCDHHREDNPRDRI